MDPTSPNENQIQQPQESGDSGQSNNHSPELQARFNELTARLKAAEAQNQTLISKVAELATVRQAPVQQQPEVPELPEGIDPQVAQYLTKTIEAATKPLVEQTRTLHYQLAEQRSLAEVNTKYGHLPENVRSKASEYWVVMKQKYPDANMDDAIKLAYGDVLLAQGTQQQSVQQQRQQFNQMPQAMRMPGAPMMPSNTAQQNALIPPTQDPNWDSYDWREQNKRIDEFLKKGGKLVG